MSNVFTGLKGRVEQSKKIRANARRDEIAKRRNTNADIIDAMESSDKADSKRLQDEKVEMELEENRKIIKKANEEYKQQNEEEMKNAILDYVTRGYSDKVRPTAEESYNRGELDSLKAEIGVMQEYLKQNNILPTIYNALRYIDDMRSKIINYLVDTNQIKLGHISDARKKYDNGEYNNLKEIYFQYYGDMKTAAQIYNKEVLEAERLQKQIAEAENQKRFDEQRKKDKEHLDDLKARIKRDEIEDELAKPNIFGRAMSAVGNVAKNAADDLRQRIIAGLAIREFQSKYHPPYKQQEVKMSDDFAAVAREAHKLYNMELEKIDAARAKVGDQPVHISYADLATQAGKNVTIQKQSQNKMDGGKRKSKKSKKSKKTLKK